MSYFRDQLESWLSKIDVDAKSVLDIGGGENPIKTRVNSWNVAEYKILDHDAQFKPDYLFDLNTFPDTEKKVNFPPYNKFEVAFCLEVMEYIYDPLSAIQNIFNTLKEGGVAYISFPTIYPLHNPKGIDYLRYTKNAIEKYLKMTGFKTWEITPRIATEGVDLLSSFWSTEGMHPIRNTKEVFDIGYLVKAFK